MKSKVIILLSSYNGEKYISEQLDSLIAQEQIDSKVFIRDDGSKDSTWSIIEAYLAKYPESFFLIRGENVDFAQSFTVLLKDAVIRFPQTNYFAFCDQDDV